MNTSSPISVAALLRYWRNSLADEDLMGLDSSESPVRTTMESLTSGRLNAVFVEKLQRAWQSYEARASWDKPAADADRGKEVRERREKLSAIELHWLLADNAKHFDEYERSFPGAGVALEDCINERIATLDQSNPAATVCACAV